MGLARPRILCRQRPIKLYEHQRGYGREYALSMCVLALQDPFYGYLCKILLDISVDLRDAIGDRLFLSGHGLRRDGVSDKRVLIYYPYLALDKIRRRASYETQVRNSPLTFMLATHQGIAESIPKLCRYIKPSPSREIRVASSILSFVEHRRICSSLRTTTRLMAQHVGCGALWK